MHLSDQALEAYLIKPLNRLTALTAIEQWDKSWIISGKTFKDLKAPRDINEVCLAVHVLMTFGFLSQDENRKCEKATDIRLIAIGTVTEYIEKLYPALEKLVLRANTQEKRDEFFKNLAEINRFFSPGACQHVARVIRDIKKRYSLIPKLTEQQQNQNHKRSFSDYEPETPDIKLDSLESQEEEWENVCTKKVCLKSNRYFNANTSLGEPSEPNAIKKENDDERLNVYANDFLNKLLRN